MYVKSRGRNIIIHEAPRPEGLGWPGAAQALMAMTPAPAAPADPLAALRGLSTGTTAPGSPPSWGAMAAQSSGNPLQALATKPGTSVSGSNFLDRLVDGARAAGQQIGGAVGLNVGGGSPTAGGSMVPLLLVGGLGVAAVLLLRKKGR